MTGSGFKTLLDRKMNKWEVSQVKQNCYKTKFAPLTIGIIGILE
jgi:hypothetical protein